jgi:hypothetical protein
MLKALCCVVHLVPLGPWNGQLPTIRCYSRLPGCVRGRSARRPRASADSDARFADGGRSRRNGQSIPIVYHWFRNCRSRGRRHLVVFDRSLRKTSIDGLCGTDWWKETEILVSQYPFYSELRCGVFARLKICSRDRFSGLPGRGYREHVDVTFLANERGQPNFLGGQCFLCGVFRNFILRDPTAGILTDISARADLREVTPANWFSGAGGRSASSALLCTLHEH